MGQISVGPWNAYLPLSFILVPSALLTTSCGGMHIGLRSRRLSCQSCSCDWQVVLNEFEWDHFLSVLQFPHLVGAFFFFKPFSLKSLGILLALLNGCKNELHFHLALSYTWAPSWPQQKNLTEEKAECSLERREWLVSMLLTSNVSSCLPWNHLGLTVKRFIF